MNNRLGCLSPLALLSLFLTVLVLLGAEVLSGNSMFSPGELHTAHAQTGTDCGQCHAPFWSFQRMTDRCLTCHTEIQAELNDPATLHGSIAAQPNSLCQDCHTEHGGPNAELTVIDTASFPHEVTGFALTAHRTRSPGIPFVCSDCHAESFTQFDQRTCLECHGQINLAWMTTHFTAFGENCLACHDGHDRFSNFDHANTAFALTGKHQNVACSACHPNARALIDLQGQATACEACHLSDDTHAGRFGSTCGVCHTPDGWKPATFDHNLAAFKLTGAHQNVPCQSCHLNDVYQGTPTACYACHKADDPHNGQFGTACETCHNTSSWKDATFDHNLTAFKLTGAHQNVPCQSCHQNGLFKGTPTACVACHREPAYHAGMFSSQACSQCHTTSAWRPATYTGPHVFPMNHGDARACKDCHQPTLATWTCYTCHNRAEIVREHTEEGISDIANCLRCHPTGQEGEGEGGEGGGD